MINFRQLNCLLLSLTALLLLTVNAFSQQSSSKPDPTIEQDFPTPLLQAIYFNQPKAVSELLAKGFSPNGIDHDNFTKIPLLLATERRNIQIVKMLLDAGAEKEVREKLGLTAIFLAVGNQDLPMVDVLIYRGLDVNAKGDGGDTPLMMAAQLGAIPIMKFLIEAGADANVANEYGVTALMAAKDDSEVVELLLKANAKIETKDEDGATAACYANRSNQPKKLAALLKNGAKNAQCPK